ncbi:hypothetical protein ABZP36_020877 [Zizania latifolia]
MSKLLAVAALRIVLTLLALCACAAPRVRGADDYTAFVYAGCSQARYDAGSQYAADVDTVLSSLTNSAGYTAYANYTSPSAAATDLVGLYQCRSDLSAAICGGCVKSAVTKLASLCNSAAGAAVQLRACFVRYGNDSFLGRQDTTVLFKKCGGESGDTGVVAMRDAALGALAAAAAPADEGSYRSGTAGYVQVMSQCVGDLGAKACSDCVSAASSQLKAGCGYASAGELTRSSEENVASEALKFAGIDVLVRADESGKTLAIIIGLVAAVALVIIFLSFVRRAGGVGVMSKHLPYDTVHARRRRRRRRRWRAWGSAAWSYGERHVRVHEARGRERVDHGLPVTGEEALKEREALVSVEAADSVRRPAGRRARRDMVANTGALPRGAALGTGKSVHDDVFGAGYEAALQGDGRRDRDIRQPDLLVETEPYRQVALHASCSGGT